LVNGDNYVSYYSREKKIPIAVEIVLTKDKCEGKADRKNSKFKEDKRILKPFRSILKDY
jgi:DNA/RNA endonuclease G (NUC1)